MKHIIKFLFIGTILLCNSSFAQEWVNKYCEEKKLTMNDINKLVAGIYDKMKESINNKAPNFTFLQVENDSSLSLNSFNGKVVIINFGGPSCSGCRMQFPELSKLQDKYYDKGLRIVYISYENKDTLKKFFNKNSIAGIKGFLEESEMIYPYQVFAKPSAYLIDKEGIIRDTWIFPEKLEMLEKRIQPFIVLNNK